MQGREVSRREVVMGLAAALALVFAPLDRFMAWLGRMLAAILGRPRAQLRTYESIEVTLNGVPFTQVAGIDFGYSGDKTAMVIGRKPAGSDGPWVIEWTCQIDGADYAAIADLVSRPA